MDSFGTIKQADLDHNGQQRRKYEINEAPAANTGGKIVGGLLLANAMLVLKSVFFTAESEDAKEAGQSATEGQQQSSVVDRPTKLTVVPENKDKKKNEEPPEETPRDSAGSTRNQSSETGVRSEALGPDSSETVGTVIPFPTASPRPAGLVSQDSVRVTDEPGPATSGGRSSDRASVGSAASDENETEQETQQESESRSNRLPVATSTVVLSELFVNQSIAIGMTDLLAGATDPDGDLLTVMNLTASSGTLTQNAAGDGWIFTPEAHRTGPITLRYEISDGKGMTTQTASFDVLELPGRNFFGTDQDDTIVATPGSDTIFAEEGDDTVIAREGDDIINTGSGDDRIVAGSGNDEIYAGSGNDVVFAGAGDDAVYAGDGDDFVSGDDGDDQIFGEGGDDTILAGLGDDEAFGGLGQDVLDGGAGMDLLYGGADDDVMSGGAGDDTLFGEDGNDLISAGEGRDFASGGAGNDTISAGAGDDVVEGNSGVDNLSGNDGNDILIGGDDNDTLNGDQGNDTMLGGAGDDALHGGAGNDVALGGAGSDEIYLGDGNDIAVALHNDGDDYYSGGAGVDTYDASQATDGVLIDLNDGIASSEEFGDDQLIGFENVIGGAGDDVVIANEQSNSLTGGGGNDIFVFVHSSSSGSGGHERDRIEDFEVGDRIDVSLLDGDDNQEGLQRLTFDYDQANFDGPGQVLFAYHGQDDEVTLIRFNFDDDDEAEFEIEIVGRYDFSDDDFIT